MSPEVLLPDGEGEIKLCWLCAHAIVDHEVSLEAAPQHECRCAPSEIYPDRVKLGVVHGDVDRTKPRTEEEMLRGSSFHGALTRNKDVVLNGYMPASGRFVGGPPKGGKTAAVDRVVRVQEKRRTK